MEINSIMCTLALLLIAITMTAGTDIWRHGPRSKLSSLSSAKLNALYYLDNMISCTTDRTFLQTLIDFGSYGCYCGFGGFGEPVDDVDSCCQAHDACYEATHAWYSGECVTTLISYLIPYMFSMHNCDTPQAHITCANIEEYPWYSLLPECAVAICQCDKGIAECIARYPYHEKYRYYNRLKCLFNNASHGNEIIV